MEVSLSGISHPKLALDPTVITGMKRRADGLEFCETQGMSAKKFFVTRKVQGIYMRHQTGTPTSLIVNVDNDEKFICD